MKWFKHNTDLSDEEFMAELEEKFGLGGYARLLKLREAVAKKMTSPGQCSVVFPWAKWCSILKGKRKKLETFLNHLKNRSEINLKETGNVLEIKYPKLLILADEYFKRSGHPPNIVQKISPLEKEEDKEEDKELIKERENIFPPQSQPKDVLKFINQAQSFVKKTLSRSLLLKPKEDKARIAAMLGQIDYPTLMQAFEDFVVSKDPFLGDKPRNIAVFSGQVMNYVNQVEQRVKEKVKARQRQAEDATRGPIQPGDPGSVKKWKRFLETLEGEIPNYKFRELLIPLVCRKVEAGKVILVCRDPDHQKAVREDFEEMFQFRLTDFFGKPMDPDFVIERVDASNLAPSLCD